MKVRTDIVKMYKEIHGWVGIVSGLALFIAFYAGAITMFEVPLQRWASPPSGLSAPVSLDRTPELVSKVLAAHPEAAKGYQVHLQTGPENPARVSWETGGRGEDDHAPRKTFYAALDSGGALEIEEAGPSPVAQFVDVLHQQVGLPFAHEVAMPIMGAIALLYAIALVSGVIVLLPSLVKDLFATRVGKNAKRMWLDVHNVLGVFSLPFHIVMALTAVVFAFHDQFYDAQGATFAKAPEPITQSAPPPERLTPRFASPIQVVERMKRDLPGYTIQSISYRIGPDGKPGLSIMADNPRYGLRGPTYTLGVLDPETAAITRPEYLPGLQGGWDAAITSFFALHFGNFGGNGVRWAYALLGLAGAFLFYTGNLLWVESRRRKERKTGAVEQTRATRILAALTVGVPLGCMAGISITVAAAKPMGLSATEGLHSTIYYAVFLGMTAWALVRGAPRASNELVPATIAAIVSVPVISLLTMGTHPWHVPLVDIASLTIAGALWFAWRSARYRTRHGPRDSVWSVHDTRPAAAGRDPGGNEVAV
jgi:uncharacterized iron-regulated membrane protein